MMGSYFSSARQNGGLHAELDAGDWRADSRLFLALRDLLNTDLGDGPAEYVATALAWGGHLSPLVLGHLNPWERMMFR